MLTTSKLDSHHRQSLKWSKIKNIIVSTFLRLYGEKKNANTFYQLFLNDVKVIK